MRISETMLVAPLCVARLRASVELGVRIGEHETYVDVWVLFFDKQVFLPVADSEPAFAFDEKLPVFGNNFEVRGVFGFARRPVVGQLVRFKMDCKAGSFYLLCALLFQP